MSWTLELKYCSKIDWLFEWFFVIMKIISSYVLVFSPHCAIEFHALCMFWKVKKLATDLEINGADYSLAEKKKVSNSKSRLNTILIWIYPSHDDSAIFFCALQFTKIAIRYENTFWENFFCSLFFKILVYISATFDFKLICSR